MSKITSTFLAFLCAAGLAFAGDEPCTGCKGTASETSALAKARKGIAAIPEADKQLPAETLAKVKEAREELMKTSFGKTLGPAFESCGWLMIAASAQPGTSAEQAALLKDMGATYCSVAKMFGGCADCKCCEDSSECCEACMKDTTPDALAKKATESVEGAKKLYMAAGAEMQAMTPEQGAKFMAYADTLQKSSPCWKAMEAATAALNDGFASLAKLGVPASEGTATRDTLVKAAAEMHGMLTACHSCDESKEECDEAKPKETVAPEKSS